MADKVSVADGVQKQRVEEPEQGAALALQARRLTGLEQRVEALTFALGAVVPDGGLLLTALMTAPREGWPAVVEAYRIGQSRKNRGAGI